MEAAKVYASKSAAQIAESTKIKLMELKKYADEGDWTWKILGLIAGLSIAFINSMAFLSDIFGLSPFSAVLDLYLVCFGLVLVVLEYQSKLLTASYMEALRREALFLCRPYGRAAFYFFIGMILRYIFLFKLTIIAILACIFLRPCRMSRNSSDC